MRYERFSLASLLLVVTVSAVFLAAMAMAAASPEKDALGRLISGAGLGAIVGIGVGYFISREYARPHVKILCFLAGGLAGVPAGVMVAVPTSALAVLVGAPLVVAFALVVWYYSRRRQDEPPP